MLKYLFQLFTLVCVAGLLLNARQAGATLLAYESFDYAPGTLNGKGPGDLGFSGTWSGGLASYTVQSGNLAYPAGSNLPTNGNMATLTGGAGTIQQNMSTSIDFSANGTYYASFLVRKNANLDVGNEFLWVSLNNAGDASYKAAFGLGSTESMLLGDATAGFSLTATNYYGINETYLYLAKIVTNSGATPDQYFAKMISASSGTVPLTEPVWDLTHAAVVNGIANRFELNIGSLSNYTVDAFRLSTNYFDATQIAIPAPEPSSLLLLGLGTCLLSMKRRRTSQQAAQQFA